MSFRHVQSRINPQKCAILNVCVMFSMNARVNVVPGMKYGVEICSTVLQQAAAKAQPSYIGLALGLAKWEQILAWCLEQTKSDTRTLNLAPRVPFLSLKIAYASTSLLIIYAECDIKPRNLNSIVIRNRLLETM